MSVTTIWRMERGKLNPRPVARAKIIHALGYTDEAAFFTRSTRPTAESNGIQRFQSNVEGRIEDIRAPGAKPLPIYGWGACGDPRDTHSAPDPVDRDYPPIGAERLVGLNGFGVRIKGESLANRDIHDGDTVWVNPDTPPRIGRIVVARMWNSSDEELGMVVKVWKNTDGMGERLWGDGEGDDGKSPVLGNYTIIGPVVWIQPQGFPPR
jgi:SOS-response transcriptional repressor LexA